jgi:hypothetical protein
MILFIPVATGQIIPMRVVHTIGMQTEPMFIRSCSTAGVVESKTPADKTRAIVCQCNSRNLAVSYAQLYENELYFAMQDRTIAHLFSDNYSECIKFLDNEQTYGAIAIPRKMKDTHVLIWAFVIRSDIFRGMVFIGHTCESVMKSCNDRGFKFGYLPGKVRIEDVE